MLYLGAGTAGSNPAAPTRAQQGCSLLQPLFYTWSSGKFNARLQLNVFDAFTGLTAHVVFCTLSMIV